MRLRALAARTSRTVPGPVRRLERAHRAEGVHLASPGLAGLARLPGLVPAAVVLLAGAMLAATATWGKAVEVPGTASLNTGGYASVNDISCPVSGDCLAIGGYADLADETLPGFLVTERNGRWGKAFTIPGSGKLHGTEPFVDAVSCSSPGNCAAGGAYSEPRSAGQDGLLVTERDGRWSDAFDPVAKLDSRHFGQVLTVSCPSDGNCTAGGFYAGGKRGTEVFVISQHDGTWGKAIEVPGIATLNTGHFAELDSVSCASAGNCSAGGYYFAGDVPEAFVVTEHDNTWDKAIEVPAGIGYGQISSVSCASAGNCAAGGYAAIATNKWRWQSFVVSERDGTWQRAIAIPGTVGRSQDPSSGVTQVSCGQAGDCTAVGLGGGNKGFIVAERNGRWGTPMKVPVPGGGTAGSAVLSAISCTPAGDCTGGGSYAVKRGIQAFVITEHDGHWGTPAEVPGSAALNTGINAGVYALSCPAHGHCAAGGYYSAGPNTEAFVASQDR